MHTYIRDKILQIHRKFINKIEEREREFNVTPVQSFILLQDRLCIIIVVQGFLRCLLCLYLYCGFIQLQVSQTLNTGIQVTQTFFDKLKAFI